MRAKAYNAWRDAQRRCEDPTRHNHENYKKKGIQMCPEWKTSFAVFVRDMGYPTEGQSLERADNNLGYTPQNCCWASTAEQADNKGSYKNSTSGIKGVSYDSYYHKWAAHTKGGNESKKRIYFGQDFFEACCVRKSWEIRNGR